MTRSAVTHHPLEHADRDKMVLACRLWVQLVLMVKSEWLLGHFFSVYRACPLFNGCVDVKDRREADGGGFVCSFVPQLLILSILI